MQTKPRARLQQPKTDKQSNSLPLIYFTEHFAGMSEKPPQKRNENKENSNLESGGSISPG
jgi:hypothetical protein